MQLAIPRASIDQKPSIRYIMLYEDTKDLFGLEDLSTTVSAEPSGTRPKYNVIEADQPFEDVDSLSQVQRQTQELDQIWQKGVHFSSGKHLTKGRKRQQLIRKIKKVVRYLGKDKFTRELLEKFGIMKDENAWLLRRLQNIYQSNKDLFDALKDTAAGPATDGKARRQRLQLSPPTEKTFNYSFCMQFYLHESVRDFHATLMELLYGRIEDVDPVVLCRKFNEFCCWNTQHSEDCVVKWKNVLKFIWTTMLEELGLPPVLETWSFTDFGDFDKI